MYPRIRKESQYPIDWEIQSPTTGLMSGSQSFLTVLRVLDVKRFLIAYWYKGNIGSAPNLPKEQTE